MKANKAYLSLGSNLGDREKFLEKAISEIKKITDVTKKSKIYETSPVGYKNQGAFLNMVIQVKTNLTPQKLLEEFMKIEKKLGRERRIKNGPRTIDIDILTFGNTIVDEPNLKIPHPRMHERKFVLVPLMELIDKNETISQWTKKK
ncbi:2-amino-4-hydroxy-6-hydroxymethyldihydropteridine diphosphokinase [Candidatus Peregrinibacteria bacterium CG_4_10_14_0_2_um_filter_38_24]|nr:MAG: 2-amino-4-hydroxy-6-hydroxymethyldihydropteridine diphosphokinase [Candidatus Peregrinibacteria bacterium CG_4_10_14_0_2_um_filter_38_24]PJC39285.1 MAG: 2-amino-4-hydroxy-6-hydroxymethyldihydropteridine diphosphokinase [Candidatus Peregrinibacteria bacterium CG_4_9_14_0_2_um_filter_38_9]